MRTYHYVQLTVLQPILYVIDFLCCTQSAHVIDGTREVLQPRRESRVVLKRKYRGRHQHGDLFTVSHSLEGRPDRNLGLSESDIPADKPVHRAVVLHIPFHRLVGRLLIRSVLVHE